MVWLREGRPSGGVFLAIFHKTKAMVPGDLSTLKTVCACALPVHSPLSLSVLPQQRVRFFLPPSLHREAVNRAADQCSSHLFPPNLEKMRAHPQEGIAEPELSSSDGEVGGVGEMGNSLC